MQIVVPTNNLLYMGYIFVKVAVAPPPRSPFKQINNPKISVLFTTTLLFIFLSLSLSLSRTNFHNSIKERDQNQIQNQHTLS